MIFKDLAGDTATLQLHEDYLEIVVQAGSQRLRMQFDKETAEELGLGISELADKLEVHHDGS